MQVGWYLLAVLSNRIFLVRWESRFVSWEGSPFGLRHIFTSELDIFSWPQEVSAAWDTAHILCNNCFIDCPGGIGRRLLHCHL